ncbi:type VI secretion system ATPase TssH [Insolitispirillum peregrinum]|uniref:Type VI secretion system protein VasG n=1 Tax=Insolitispirillum peregrinum TaxID=80876 RepID=A0A1N7JGT4_9PROT|nr:type VI secretion system ATPase TssH [Insolitispirillum peregrinum]SIS48508.1 type VI secretion system protein VasG [Insolitispirillum peregrinum]
MSSAETLKELVTRLGPPCRKALERAAELCVQRTHYNVEPEHFLLALLDQSDNDLALILRAYGVDGSKIRGQLDQAVARFKQGATRTPAFSPHLPKLLEEAWVRASLSLGETRVRSSAVLLAFLEHDTLRSLLLDSAPTLLTVTAARLRGEIAAVTAGSTESPLGAGSAPAAGAAASAEAAGKGGALDAYTLDITAEARAGRIDPVFGREREIRAVIDILMRRRQNNPILTGEAGVGKTAVVEGFAQKIVSDDVPPALKGVVVRSLDLGLLQAGTSLKGEFESRLKGVIAEVKASPVPVILFIDEAHTLMGAGGEQGVGDAANLLKPAMARGELRTIGATTWAEYKKTIEKDPALARRFQVVKVAEPDEETAIGMLRGLVPTLEKHHGVCILDEAVVDAVHLSGRYIVGRQLPDKGISVLDTACARVALGLHGTPVDIEALNHDLASIDRELAILDREEAQGRPHASRIDELESRRRTIDENRTRLESRWQQELATVRKIHALEQRAGQVSEVIERAQIKDELAGLRLELDVLQAGAPLVLASVDGAAIAGVVSAWTGIPVGRMVSDEIQAVLSLRERMAERVVGQDHALEAVAQRIQTSRAGLDEPGKPTGVFLLAGPSGVGKTETALTMAELLYGGERRIVTINMSEYQEAHSVSRLKGAPPGYVGFGQGGVLTEAVKRNPYCVVLLDEVEKAHPDVIELFYQVFDKGTLEDTDGVVVDFKNTVIMLTSNLGSDTITHLCAQHRRPEPSLLIEAIHPELLAHFKAALLGRLTVVPYYPLDEQRVRTIVTLKLKKIADRFQASHGVPLDIDPAVVAAMAERCVSTDSGARAIDHLLSGALLPDLSVAVLQAMADGRDLVSARVSLAADGTFAIALRSLDDSTGGAP